MSTFHIISDLHLEFVEQNIENLLFKRSKTPEKNYLCVLGDVCSIDNIHLAKRFFENNAPYYEKIFYVLGNHEYYTIHKDRDMELVHEQIRGLFSSNKKLVLLGEPFRKTPIVIHGKRSDVFVIGETLWSVSSNPTMKLLAMRALNDYHYIYSKPHKKIIPDDVEALQKKNKEYLLRMMDLSMRSHFYLGEGKKRKLLILTHAAPSHKSSLDIENRNIFLDGSFSTDCSKIIHCHKRNIGLWAHGHTHKAVDYTLDGVRIVSDPYGYRGAAKSHKNISISF